MKNNFKIVISAFLLFSMLSCGSGGGGGGSGNPGPSSSKGNSVEEINSNEIPLNLTTNQSNLNSGNVISGNGSFTATTSGEGESLNIGSESELKSCSYINETFNPSSGTCDTKNSFLATSCRSI